MGSLHTGNVYLDHLEGDLPHKGGMDIVSIVTGGSGIEDTVGGGVCLGCGCGLGPVIFLLATALPFPFIGRTEEAIGRGWGTSLASRWEGLGISVGSSTLSSSCTFGI